MLRPGSNEVALHANFGVLVSPDGGGAWKLVCEELIGSTLISSARWSAAGDIHVASYDGLFRSAGPSCAWAEGRGDLAGQSVWDVAFDPTSTARILALATDRTTDAVALHESLDAGVTYARKTTFRAGIRLNQVAIAPSDPMTVYLAGYATSPYRFVMEYTTDGGATWDELLPAGGFVGADVTLVGVSPDDPRTVYFSRVGASSTVADDLWRSTDHGRAPQQILKLNGAELQKGFAFGADGRTLYVAGREVAPLGEPSRGTLYVSRDRGDTFAPPRPGGPAYRCLGYRAGRLYACAGDEAAGDRFALGISDDEGTTWTGLLAFRDLAGPVACAGDRCVTTMAWLCALYGVCAGAPADAGVAPPDAGARDGAADGPPGSGDDGCRVAGGAQLSPLSPSSSAAGCLLAFLSALRRGRRPGS